MFTVIFIRIRQGSSEYGYLFLTKNCLRQCSTSEDNPRNNVSKRRIKIQLDGIILHYLCRELTIGTCYRNSFLQNFNKCWNCNVLNVSLIPSKQEIIDYDWNYRISTLVYEKCELEHALSWLSTLGGGFSALGDYFERCACIAGKISANQFKLAMRLGDSGIVSRCLLYYSLSLIQRKRFKSARKIIINEYVKTSNQNVPDIRLINMCKGIWCKLKYEQYCDRLK